jgi:lipoprotein
LRRLSDCWVSMVAVLSCMLLFSGEVRQTG